MQFIVVYTACIAVLVAVLVKFAPGDPEWEHEPLTPDQKDFIRFVGGDGSSLLSGRLFPPKEQAPNAKTPVIVLCHGLGLSQDCSLEPFVEAFTSAGFAAFTFDYATFGASDGLPRHQVKPKQQIADIHAVVFMLKQQAKQLGIDSNNIGLWGFSLGGGNVLMAASQDASIKAVTALVSHAATGAESLLGTFWRDPVNGGIGLLKIMAAMLKWATTSVFLGKTIYVPLHGPPGSSAIVQNPGDDQGYASLLPTSGAAFGWKNAATVGSVLSALVYRPLNSVSNIQSPTLLIAAENDTLCPAKQIEKAAKLITGSEMLLLQGLEHFDVYTGKPLEQVVSAAVEFFQKHLV